MPAINLRPVSPEGDFEEIAALISSQEDDPTSQSALHEDYEKNQSKTVHFTTAAGGNEELLGFVWGWRNRVDAALVSFCLVVKPAWRRQGIGGSLLSGLEAAAAQAQVCRLRVNVRDDQAGSRAFVERRGFSELKHTIGMQLDLCNFDDSRYDALIGNLKNEAFCFTSMQELGDTQENQRKLYELNDAAVLTTLGQPAEHSWASFEDFQQSVCRAEWYRPAGQIIAIDTSTGRWAALSAITRMAGRDHAYNLFTGVEASYRGRGLAKAVKVLALRYAREHLGTGIVRTHHITGNAPMLAIDAGFGYRRLPGTFLMEKSFP